MIKENYPISFCWYYPKTTNTECTAYCFAYIRDKETGECLYAGVKYEGEKHKLRNFKACLRKTAIERLISKPIYCRTPTGKVLIELLEHKNKKLNGIFGQDLENLNKPPKITTLLAKFFTNSSLFHKLPLCASKSSGLVLDQDFNVIRNVWNEKYGNLEKEKYIYIDIGCYYQDGYHLINPREKDGMVRSGINIILDKIKDLYLNSYFAGKDKQRASLKQFSEQTNHYLIQFGISRAQPFEKPKAIWMSDLEYDTRVRYSRIKLSNNYVLHLGMMKFNNWKYFIDSFSGHHYYEIDSYNYHEIIVYSRYFQKLSGDSSEDKFQSLRGRKIVYNKLIFRPVFLEIDRLLLSNVKEIQDYIVHNVYKLPEQGRFHYFGDKLQELDLCYEFRNEFVYKPDITSIKPDYFSLRSIYNYFLNWIKWI